MKKNKILKGYQGIFFDKEEEKKLIELQEKGLNNNIENMHIRFKFGEIEKYPDELMEKEFNIKIIGYDSDGKNSGFLIKIPDELKKLYKSCNIPHITVSVGEKDGIKGKTSDTAKLQFKKVKDKIEIKGKLGYFIFGQGKYMDNSFIKIK